MAPCPRIVGRDRCATLTHVQCQSRHATRHAEKCAKFLDVRQKVAKNSRYPQRAAVSCDHGPWHLMVTATCVVAGTTAALDLNGTIVEIGATHTQGPMCLFGTRRRRIRATTRLREIRAFALTMTLD